MMRPDSKQNSDTELYGMCVILVRPHAADQAGEPAACCPLSRPMNIVLNRTMYNECYRVTAKV